MSQLQYMTTLHKKGGLSETENNLHTIRDYESSRFLNQKP